MHRIHLAIMHIRWLLLVLLFAIFKVGFRILVISILVLVIMDLSKWFSVESLHLRRSISSVGVSSVYSKMLIVLWLVVLEWLLLILISSLSIVVICSEVVVDLILGVHH